MTDTLSPPGDRLLPAQREASDALCAAEGFILADDMGTGKTVMACDALRRIGAERVLVVCPKKAKPTWERHAEEGWAGELVARSGSGKQATAAVALTAEYGGIAVVNWEAMRIHGHDWDVAWDVVIADEAHRAKNPLAKQTKALARIEAARRWALTGTPVANEPDDFWSILSWVRPDKAGRLDGFLAAYCAPVSRKPVIYEWRDLKALREDLAAVLMYRPSSKVLGRTITKRHRTLEVPMTDKQAAAYLDLWEDFVVTLAEGGRGKVHERTIAQRLWQVCQGEYTFTARDEGGDDDGGERKVRTYSELTGECPKADAAARIVAKRSEPILVMGRFEPPIRATHAALQAAGVPSALVTGATKDPQEAYDAFQGGEVRALAATVGTSGEGIDLTAASKMIWMQQDWSLISAVQGENRIHRYTQPADTVSYLTLVAVTGIEHPYKEGEPLVSMDELVSGILGRKRGLLDGLRGVASDRAVMDAVAASLTDQTAGAVEHIKAHRRLRKLYERAKLTPANLYPLLETCGGKADGRWDKEQVRRQPAEVLVQAGDVIAKHLKGGRSPLVEARPIPVRLPLSWPTWGGKVVWGVAFPRGVNTPRRVMVKSRSGKSWPTDIEVVSVDGSEVRAVPRDARKYKVAV